MKAMLLKTIARMRPDADPLVLEDRHVPEPAAGEIRIRLSACGVCHTELDEIEGRTPPPALPVVPGHEAVGRVEAVGADSRRYQIGDRVGVGWIHASNGEPDENLSPEFRATGRDADGGYAECMTVSERYAFPIPDVFSDIEAAPLLCAGAVGYRSLRLADLENGQNLGLTGFGGSAHLVLQLFRHRCPDSRVAVFARDPAQRTMALALGADWAGATEDRAPFELAAIIDTTPAWRPVVAALASLAPQGRLVINAIRKENTDIDCLTRIRYEEHLWQEKRIQSVANVTGADIAEFLPLAAEVPLKPEIQVYPFEEANQALRDLRFAPIHGAKVLVFGQNDAAGT